MSNSNYAINMDDIPDIQGLILRGYNYPCIKYIILKINDAAGARAFCKALLPQSKGAMCITDAQLWPVGAKPEYCLNIAFTYYGMQQLIGTDNCTKVWGKSYGLFNLFKIGAINDAPNVGDTADSDPSLWWTRSGEWQLPTQPAADGSDLHIQLTLFTLNDADRGTYYNTLLGMIPETNGVKALVPAFVIDSDPIIVDGDDTYIHFGYRDSLSQPRIENPLWNKKKTRLLYGISTIDDRPQVPPYYFVIKPSTPVYTAHPLLTNGCFSAFRLLHQDVKAFNSFIASDPGTSPDLVAAKMCGRWFDGTPLVVSPNGEDKSLKDFDYTNFNYLTPTPNQQGPRQSDDAALMCPYAAHIRRANPRDDVKVQGNVNLGTGEPLYAQMHRVLRRASPFGPVYQAGVNDDKPRGLVGHFMGAKLTDQFQFIMGQWISAGGFRNPYDASPNSSGIDPLFGPQTDDEDPNDQYFAFNQPKGYHEIPAQGSGKSGLTRFIRTDGGMYLFFPGITGLDWIAQGTIPAS